MTSGIYRIYCKSEDKSYIGKSINIEERWKQHLYELKKGNHINNKLQKVFNKYGKDNFEFSILKEIDDYYEIAYYESYYAEKFNAFNKGYNIAKLFNSQDIKYVLKNLKDLSKEWLSILKENSKRISKEKWNREIKLEDLSKRLNLSRDKTIIFIKFFRDEEYNCRVILGDIININYINKGYMDKTYSNLYI
mgnify:FL=1|jgi:group I intron endonuclease|nr:MAG TPA: intron associated endonuclease [Caudoviricetes sp.]